jgi:hypothetical protein
MKALCSTFIAIVVAMSVAGCSKHAQPATPGTDATANAPTNSSPQPVQTQLKGLAGLKQAIQTFNTTEGHFPKSLDELAPKYIAQVPPPPGGYKFAYNAATGELRLARP